MSSICKMCAWFRRNRNVCAHVMLRAHVYIYVTRVTHIQKALDSTCYKRRESRGLLVYIVLWFEAGWNSLALISIEGLYIPQSYLRSLCCGYGFTAHSLIRSVYRRKTHKRQSFLSKYRQILSISLTFAGDRAWYTHIHIPLFTTTMKPTTAHGQYYRHTCNAAPTMHV
jgi:hypothetical protein